MIHIYRLVWLYVRLYLNFFMSLSYFSHTCTGQCDHMLCNTCEFLCLVILIFSHLCNMYISITALLILFIIYHSIILSHFKNKALPIFKLIYCCVVTNRARLCTQDNISSIPTILSYSNQGISHSRLQSGNQLILEMGKNQILTTRSKSILLIKKLVFQDKILIPDTK